MPTPAGAPSASVPGHATDGTGQRGHAAPVHVWVCVTGRWHERVPGILLAWERNRRGRWQAQVVTATGGGTTPTRAEVHWVDQDHVRRVDDA